MASSMEALNKKLIKFRGNLGAIGKTAKDLNEKAPAVKAFAAPLTLIARAAIHAAKGTKQGSAAAAKMKTSMQSLQKGLIPLGMVLLKLANQFLPIIVKGVQKLGQWFSKLSPTLQKIIIGMGAFLVILGPIVGFIGGLLTTVSLLSSALVLLTNPVFLIIAGLVALGITLMVAWKKSATFRAIVMKTWTAIKTGIKALWTFIQPIILAIVTFFLSQFNKIKIWWIQTWPRLKQAFSNIWKGIWTVLKPIVMGIVQLMKWAWPLVKKIISVAMKIVQQMVLGKWNSIKKVISSALNIIMNVISLFANLFTGHWSDMFKNIWAIIKNAFVLIWNLIKVLGVGRILKIVGRLKGGLLGIFKTMWSRISGTIRNYLRDIWNSIVGKFNNIIRWITGLGGRFFSAGKGLIHQIIKGIKGAIGGVLRTVSNLASKIRNFLPFSPAKVGPLSDLDKLDFGGPIKNSISRALPEVRASMAHLLKVPAMKAVGISGIGSEVAIPQQQIRVDYPNGPIHAKVNIGGHDADATIEFITKKQVDLKRRTQRLGGK